MPGVIDSVESRRRALRIGASHTANADDLMRGVYHLDPHPPVAISQRPTWSEDPFGDANWSFQFHSLRFVYSLFDAWELAGEARYLTHAKELLHDWCLANPFEDARLQAWDQHAAALRAMVLSCASTYFDAEQWLFEALELHGKLLREYFVARGNHALNQQIGLLCVGVALGRNSWVQQAAGEILRLFADSVDDEGVTNEQSVYYQYYNYSRYSEAFDRMTAAGIATGSNRARLELMTRMLAHATMPDGSYANLGDTEGLAQPIDGTAAEYAATHGARGSKPDELYAKFDAGFVFGRTGWGESRPFEHETFYSLRFGPPRHIHGHFDGGSISLFASGKYLVVDSGKYKYVPAEKDPYRSYFVGARAHNRIVCSGRTAGRQMGTELLVSRHELEWDYHQLSQEMGLATKRWSRALRCLTGQRAHGATWRRSVFFVRHPGFLVIEDCVASSKREEFEQVWHLPPESSPILNRLNVETRLPEGNLLITQVLDGDFGPRLVCGSSSPVDGWYSPAYGERVPAPTVSWRRRGKQVRWLTLLLPFTANNPLAAVRLGDGRNKAKVYITAYGVDYVLSFEPDNADVSILCEGGSNAR
jgi:hypothetical protein